MNMVIEDLADIYRLNRWLSEEAARVADIGLLFRIIADADVSNSL